MGMWKRSRDVGKGAEMWEQVLRGLGRAAAQRKQRRQKGKDRFV